MALKIVLVDDQPVPGLTLRRWLRKQRELEVVGEAVPGSPVLALIPLVQPDAILLDVQTSPEAGLNVARQIRESYPTVPVVAIGDPSAGSIRMEAAEAGAWAFIPKTSPADLAKAIPAVIAGKGAFVDLSDRNSHRPPSEGFVALPDQKTTRRARSESFVALPEEKQQRRAGAESFVALPEEQPQRAASEPAAPSPTEIPAPATAKTPPVTPTAHSAPAPKRAPSPPPAQEPKAQPRAAGASRTARPAAPKPTPPQPAKAPSPPRSAKAVRQSPPPAETDRPARKSPATEPSRSAFELVPASRTARPRDAVAWTHPDLEPVLDSPAKKKPRRRRGKQEQVPLQSDVRGQYGLPRRYGGHR